MESIQRKLCIIPLVASIHIIFRMIFHNVAYLYPLRYQHYLKNNLIIALATIAGFLATIQRYQTSF